MVFIQVKVNVRMGLGGKGLFAGLMHSGRASAAPDKACMSDSTQERTRAVTSLDFASLGSVCVHTRV